MRDERMNNEHVNEVFHQALKIFQIPRGRPASKNSTETKPNLVAQGDKAKKQAKEGGN